MEDALCFSTGQMVFLGSVWVIIQGVVLTLFWGWIRSLETRVKDAQAETTRVAIERDRVTERFEEALNLGEKAARTRRRA